MGILKLATWTDWRFQEQFDARRYMRNVRAHIKGKSERSLKEYVRHSYLLRDLVVACLDRNDGTYTRADVARVAAGLAEILGKKIDLTRTVSNSFRLWHGHHTSVEAYLTPKSLLYTVRGDYETKLVS